MTEQEILQAIERKFDHAAQVVELTHKPTLTTKEVARLYGLHPDTLTKWRHFKKGPRYFKDGRIILYHQKDVQQYLETGLVRTSDQS